MGFEPKWTPGPWLWSGGTGVHRPNGRWLYVETTVPHKQAVANARLIAAAPDLYAALEPLDAVAVDRAVDAPEWRDKDTVSVLLSIGELRAVRAALTKARGQA